MANAYYNYGKEILGWLSDNQTLPNATTVDSTNMVNIVGRTNGALWINVYAHTAITIATGQAFSIELQGYTSDTAASATSPFSTGNKGGDVATGDATAESDAHYYLLHKTSADGELAFAAGDLITQCAIPEDLFNALEYDYVQLVYVTDASEVTETVDAFVYAKL